MNKARYLPVTFEFCATYVHVYYLKTTPPSIAAFPIPSPYYRTHGHVCSYFDGIGTYFELQNLQRHVHPHAIGLERRENQQISSELEIRMVRD